MNEYIFFSVCFTYPFRFKYNSHKSKRFCSLPLDGDTNKATRPYSNEKKTFVVLILQRKSSLSNVLLHTISDLQVYYQFS